MDDGASPRDFRAMRDVAAAYDAHRVRLGIAETKQGGMGFHALVSVSPEWIDAGGDRYDRNNPRNRALLLQAVRWLESWCGVGTVYAARMDMDEVGAGAVDAFVMPASIDGRTGRLTISASKALTRMRLKHGERMSFVALQSDWALHCKNHLDREIERGRPKTETLIQHLEVEEYKAAASEAGHRVCAAAAKAEAPAELARVLLEKLSQLELTAEERLAAEQAAEALAALLR